MPATYSDLGNPNWTGWSHLLDLATLQWRRGPEIESNGNNVVHICAAYDPGTDAMWLKAETISAGTPLIKFNGTTVTKYTGNTYATDYVSVAAVDTRRSRFVQLWNGTTAFSTDLANPNSRPSPINVGGGPGEEPAFEYIPDLDKFIAWRGSSKTVYTLNAANLAAGWSTEGTGSAATPPSCTNGSFSKYVYVPQVKCLIGMSDVNQVAYAYRPMGT